MVQMNLRSTQQQHVKWCEVSDRYNRSLHEQWRLIKSLGRAWNLLSYVRGGLFVSALLMAFVAYRDFGGLSTMWWIVVALVAVAFLVIVAVHDRVERQLERAKNFAEYFAEGTARCQRDWKGLPVPPIEATAKFRPVALDLDVFGRASLAQLFSPVRTAVGLPMLRDWLINPAPPTEIRARQQAANELANDFSWREQFQLNCRIASASPVGSERFLAWVRSPCWLLHFPVLTWLARISACLVVGFGIGFFTGWIAPQVAGVSILILLAMNFLVTVFFSGKVHEIFESVSSRKSEVNQFVDLFGQLAELKANSSRLNELAAEVTLGPQSALGGLGALARIVWFGNLRRHGILFIAYLFLQFIGLWDLHVLLWLERWQLRYRERVPDWFAALAQTEVLSAMGTLAYENPDWVLPHVNMNDTPQISALQLGHPLLSNLARVCNDVAVGPPGTVLIVTGSNMSGKSTLLRSIGLNVILAQMGCVVCARKMDLHPVVLETSMRIDDSLSDGVSFFMAELRRLKEIVDRGAEARAGGNQFMFLLDEILQGTNSRERHIAVEAVIRQLLNQGAFGSFTTHDLDLAKSDGLGRLARTVYFTESFEETPQGDTMTFDYVMRSGIAPSTNALKLLRLVGLAADDSI